MSHVRNYSATTSARQGHPNRRPLPLSQLPCQLEALSLRRGSKTPCEGNSPHQLPLRGHPGPSFPPTPRGRGLSKPTALLSNPRALFPAPCWNNQSLLCIAQPASLLLPSREASLAFSNLGGEGGGYVLLVFPKRGGAALPSRCPRTGCAVGVAAAVGVTRAEAAVVRGAGWRSGQGRAGTGPGPRRRSVEGAGKRAETLRKAAGDGGLGEG